MIGYYLSHPQVQIDPEIPVPNWSLSETGSARIVAALGQPWIAGLKRIVSSAEKKAVDAADLVGDAIGVSVEVRPDMNEMDRSSTGYLPHDQHEAAADALFAEPRTSWSGWERAIDAQARIVAAVERILASHDASRPILFVGHGGVGTLLKCHLAGLPIARDQDQPGGGGNVFAFRLGDRKLLCDWTSLERIEGFSDAG